MMGGIGALWGSRAATQGMPKNLIRIHGVVVVIAGSTHGCRRDNVQIGVGLGLDIDWLFTARETDNRRNLCYSESDK